ncbi:MAG: DUF5596 domain-containing protein [Clostridia bacterium]|nr:DUF5596 domain-containing protein [Clostridia bacterium]
MIRTIALQFGFPAEAAEYLQSSYEKLLKAPDFAEDFELAEKLFLKKYYGYKEILKRLSDKTDVNLFTANMIFLLMLTPKLHSRYKEKNIADDIFFDTMQDLKYKLFECMNMHGVWGTFVPDWYMGIFAMECFKLGRLEYQKGYALETDKLDGIKRIGDRIFRCHIPSCGPLSEEDVKASLKQAKEFFKDELKGETFVLCCGSWLLYPPVVNKLKDSSNIKKFYQLFTIHTEEERPENPDFWRIFNEPYSPDAVNRIQPKGHVQETVLSHLKEGGTLGAGRGYIIVE